VNSFALRRFRTGSWTMVLIVQPLQHGAAVRKKHKVLVALSCIFALVTTVLLLCEINATPPFASARVQGLAGHARESPTTTTTTQDNVVTDAAPGYAKEKAADHATQDQIELPSPSLMQRRAPWPLDPQNKGLDWCPQALKPAIIALYQEAATHNRSPCTEIARFGDRGDGDGGKLVCVNSIRPSKCVVYSLGSRMDFTFEIDIVEHFGCEVHTFDCTVGRPVANTIPTGVSFHPWCVGGTDAVNPMGQFYSLTTIRTKLGHPTIDLLKMDIERHEFAVIPTFTKENAPRQISFETHIHNTRNGVWGGPVTDGQWTALWEVLHGLGYGAFSHEPNPQCLCCCEFSVQRAVLWK